MRVAKKAGQELDKIRNHRKQCDSKWIQMAKALRYGPSANITKELLKFKRPDKTAHRTLI
jgi:hypothetical protein